ncbi:ribokinase [Moorellaceae bacterium AZ2]
MVDIVVIGSLNMDLMVIADKMPARGETIYGQDFRMIPGGKGANQAVAAARLGASVAMVGCVGRDLFGKTLLQALAADGVDTSFVHQKPEAPTGVALISVDAVAENSIIVVPGANWLCRSEDIMRAKELIKKASVVMLQLEIPLETVSFAASLARELGKTVILDPAPVQTLPPSLLTCVDVLTPNEREAEKLSGRCIFDVKSARLAAAEILGLGVRAVLIKLGPRGVLWAEENVMEHIDGFRVKAMDSTAAGDAFNAGVAVGLAEGQPLREALKLANAAGAITTTRFGAQASLPTREAVNKLLGQESPVLTRERR